MTEIHAWKEHVGKEVHGEAEPDRRQNALETCDKSRAKRLLLPRLRRNGRNGGIREFVRVSWKLFHGVGVKVVCRSVGRSLLLLSERE